MPLYPRFKTAQTLFNAVGVNHTINKLFCTMINCFVIKAT
ncbi:hypothetical protein BROOK1789C_2062 [Bathymodiolus brooksi thiotrophic gill symbiont]|nr:hypothetical protein BROOK1789B_1677 [Bathymodiolus brooksi thiotrophic gill symbiont]CAB9544941.1 hypothetical protein BROOK1789C_2062 [Bathymodiolus brooksi thiotrophic gill symbiont]